MDIECEEQILLQVLDKLGEICGFHKESANRIDPNDILYTVTEVSKLIKKNQKYVYMLINSGLLPVIKLGSIKIRRSSLTNLLEKNEGNDLTDPFNIKKL